jgi:hypothetical protein
MNFIPNKSSWKTGYKGTCGLWKDKNKLWIYKKFQISEALLDLSAGKSSLKHKILTMEGVYWGIHSKTYHNYIDFLQMEWNFLSL